jgi:hypothetical protein
MSAKLCPAVPENFSDPAVNEIFFSDRDRETLKDFAEREDSKACTSNLFFGLFFDGTKNNYVQGLEAGN